MYLNTDDILGKLKVSNSEVSCFLLELVRPPHVRDLPVVVVSEVVGGACPFVHQIVRPLPSTEVPYNK